MNGQKLRALIGCSLFLTSCDHSSQQPPIPYDDLVHREGKCFAKFTDVPFNGTTSGSLSGEVEDGVWKGKVAWFNEEGQLNARFHFKAGLLNGQTDRFYEKGMLRYSANFQNGLLDGQTRIYRSDGKMTGEYQYRKGELTEKTDFYPDGQIEVQANYDGGVLQGSYTEFYQNGQVKIQTNYDGGTPEGLYSEFKSNGEQNYTLTFKNGRAVETSFESFNQYPDTDIGKRFNPRESVVALENGLASGEAKHYKIGNDPYVTATWKDGLLDGVCKKKGSASGDPDEYRYYFESGKYLEAGSYDSDGKEVEEGFLSEKNRDGAFSSCDQLPDLLTKQGHPSDGRLDSYLRELRGKTFTTCGSKEIEEALGQIINITSSQTD